ncbi:MAG: bacillithiol system redox-active protein YtxJ [Pedobacter sp.]|jgi:bacillithiol system protein YtxJ|uniref:bacillithiol system redox-active protein YtxJ n=1 Tax=Pedobacter sp. TaxID=1411316 RepID=UPI003566C860
MQWINLNNQEQVKLIKEASEYSVIFKHSTRCSISLMAKRNFELDWNAIPENTPLYFLDLIAHRDISALIAETFQVHHESPQVLLIKDGECILDLSHSDISAEEISESITV